MMPGHHHEKSINQDENQDRNEEHGEADLRWKRLLEMSFQFTHHRLSSLRSTSRSESQLPFARSFQCF